MLHLAFKKLPLVEIWCSFKEECPQLFERLLGSSIILKSIKGIWNQKFSQYLPEGKVYIQ